MRKQYTFKDLVFKNVGKIKASRRYLARLEFDNNYVVSVAPEFMESNKYELAILGFNDLTGDYDFLGDLSGDVFRYKTKEEVAGESSC